MLKLNYKALRGKTGKDTLKIIRRLRRLGVVCFDPTQSSRCRHASFWNLRGGSFGKTAETEFGCGFGGTAKPSRAMFPGTPAKPDDATCSTSRRNLFDLADVDASRLLWGSRGTHSRVAERTRLFPVREYSGKY